MTNKTQVGREQGRTLDKTTINLKLITRLRWAGNKVMMRIVGGTQVRRGDTESQDRGNQTEAHGRLQTNTESSSPGDTTEKPT